MDVVFFGSGSFGIPTLAALSTAHRVTGVVSQPDRPAGRGGALTPTPIAEWAATNLPGVPVLKPENVNEAGVLAAARALPAQAWVVIAFGQKLSPALLEGRFAINLHASLLPRWRGAAPINAAVLAGDAHTGNSVITLADRMDAGLILAQSRRPIDPSQTAGELHDRLAQDGPELVRGVLEAQRSGTLQPRAQDPALVTKAPKMSKADGWIDLDRPADEARRRVHGLHPWPGVTVTFRDQPLKLHRVGVVDAPANSADAPPGALIDATRGIVRCGPADAPAALQLLEVQPAGKRAMAWGEFAAGARPRAGEAIACVRPALASGDRDPKGGTR
jgi:methionyl-tRNA formyltransferase